MVVKTIMGVSNSLIQGVHNNWFYNSILVERLASVKSFKRSCLITLMVFVFRSMNSIIEAHYIKTLHFGESSTFF